MNIGFRKIVIFSSFLCYICFSVTLFIYFNNYYFENSRKKFKDENIYAAKAATDYIEYEKSKLVSLGGKISSDPYAIAAIRDDYYIKNIDIEHEKVLGQKINILYYRRLASVLKMKVFLSAQGTDGYGLELFKKYDDGKISLVTSSGDFNRKYFSTGEEKYIIDAFKLSGNSSMGKGISAEMGFLEKKEDKIFIQGLVTLGRYTDGINYSLKSAVPGIGILVRELNTGFLEDLKKYTNREIFLIKDGRLANSTIYNGNTKFENVEIKGLEKIARETYVETKINGKMMGLNIIPLTDYNNENVGYIGVGFYLEEIEGLYKESLNNFIKYDVIFSFLLFIMLYIVMTYLFKPFNRIIELIKDISEGNYRKIHEKSLHGELKILAESINKLSESIATRENELKELNAHLEQKVDERTLELKDTIEKLKKTQEQLIGTEKLASIGKLAGGIAHEVNSPLGAILSSVQFIKTDLDGIEQQKKEDLEDSINIVEAAVKKVREIISKLLIYTNKSDQRFERLDLSELIKSTVAILNAELNKHKVTILLELEEELYAEVNNVEVVQVFTYIINNAVDAIVKKGHSDKKIIIRALKDGVNARVEIEDNGIGIEEKHKAKIFDPFFTTKDIGRGMGLNLAMSYHILKKHSADIRFESKEARGTIFIIEFQLKGVSIPVEILKLDNNLN